MEMAVANGIEEMVIKLDPVLNELDELAKFSSVLDATEEYLDSTAHEILRSLDTIERAKQNLAKGKELERKVFLFGLTVTDNLFPGEGDGRSKLLSESCLRCLGT